MLAIRTHTHLGESASAPDNRGVFDDGEAQELKEEDVVAMKGQGVKGQVGHQ